MCQWGGGPPAKRVVEGFYACDKKPLRQPLRACHLPIWLRKMGRTEEVLPGDGEVAARLG